MVFYFTSNVVCPPVILHMGKNKYENEELFRFGWPEDIWFHVHHYSSAHVYLRMQRDQTIDDIPKDVLMDAAQLVKANSIHANKLQNVEVIYTLWENLKKTPLMSAGEVGFVSESAVRTIHIENRINEIINRLNKTKTEEFPNLKLERCNRNILRKKEIKLQLQVVKEQKIQQARIEAMKYAGLQNPENMTTNKDDGHDSDGFM